MSKDERFERWLAGHGVNWEYHAAVSIATFDLFESRSNQARSTALDQPTVDEYAEALKAGAEFPAVIAWTKRNRLIVIDGNHRLAAAIKEQRTTIDVYIVQTELKATIDRLTWSANSIEGRRASTAELIEHGKDLVAKYGMTHKAAAETLSLPVRVLEDAIGLTTMLSRAPERLRERLQERLPKTSLLRLNNIGNDRALAEAARIAVETRPGPDALNDLVKSVNRATTEEAQLAAVAVFAARPDIQERREATRAGRSAPPRLPKSDLFRHLSSVVQLLTTYPTFEALGIEDAADIARFHALRAQTIGRLEGTQDAHHQPDARMDHRLVGAAR